MEEPYNQISAVDSDLLEYRPGFPPRIFFVFDLCPKKKHHACMKGKLSSAMLVLAFISCQSLDNDSESTDGVSRKDGESTGITYQKNRQEIEEELRTLVLRINSDISGDGYEKWLLYLSNNYIDNYSSSEILNEISLFPRLRAQGIILENLRNYYEWVVVPSRYEAKLENVVFITGERAIAYSIYRGERVRLYELERNIDGEWQVTIWK